MRVPVTKVLSQYTVIQLLYTLLYSRCISCFDAVPKIKRFTSPNLPLSRACGVTAMFLPCLLTELLRMVPRRESSSPGHMARVWTSSAESSLTGRRVWRLLSHWHHKLWELNGTNARCRIRQSGASTCHRWHEWLARRRQETQFSTEASI